MMTGKTTERFVNLERLFLALADRTRLRLLNLMREGEICVCFFTQVLGESQPKISRHLAYLRNAGIVTARRDGKWVHYSIAMPDDEAAAAILQTTLSQLDGWPEMLEERRKYETICCTPELLTQIARTPINFISAEADMTAAASRQPSPPASHNDLDEFLL